MMKRLLCTLFIAVLAVVSIQAQVTISGGSPLVVINSGNTPSPADNTDFGSVEVGATKQFQYTIKNDNPFPVILILDNLGDQTNYEQNANFPSPLLPNQSTNFTVTFMPQSTGVKNSTVNLQVLNGGGPPPINISFNITGNATVPTPSSIITVYGDDTFSSLIPNFASAGSATETNGRDFGGVIVGMTKTKSFRIINDPGATGNLEINAIAEFGDDFEISPLAPSLPVTLAPGDSYEFSVVYSPSAVASDQSYISITYDTDQFFGFNVVGDGLIAPPDVPEINILDNSNANLTSGGSVNFGNQNVTSGSITQTFTIQNLNTQTAALNLTGASPFVAITGANASDFTLGTVPSSTIAASGSTTFTIIFDPSAIGTRTATVSIANDDSDENPYTFTLTGEGIDASAGSPLLITQYYENGNNDYIEIKNISNNPVPQQLYLCLYKNLRTTTSIISSQAPDASIQIPALSIGQVVVFKNPLAGGSGTSTAVCNFDGNDVVLISTDNDTSAYAGRLDIIGVVGTASPPTWGANTSYIKGCGTNEVPSLNFAYNSGTDTVTDYIELTTAEVDAASGTNLVLGIQTVGSTTWTSSWSNSIPDKTKSAIINGSYSSGNGSFESCDLTINASGSINFTGTSNFVKVNNNLAINGSFVLGDQAALVTVNESASITGVITKQESTTTLKQYDYTYWSSPVQGATTNVFTSTGAPADRIFEWRTPSSGDYGGWVNKSGALGIGRGYISEGPDGATQHNISFTGKPNNGVISVSLGYDNTTAGGAGGYNLIGNPYPCAIDADKFLTEPDNNPILGGPGAVTDGTIWLWTHNTLIQDNPGEDNDYVVNDYATYNLSGGTAAISGGAPPTKNIGSAQGFYVKSRGPGSTNSAFFTNVMKLDGQNTQFFRSNDNKKSNNDRDRMWLDVVSEKGGAFNQILIGFFDEATDGDDWGYDAGKFSAGNYISLYSNIDDKKYTIQGLGTYSSDKKVSIGFDSSIKENFSISISKLEGILNNEEIYLVDNYLNIVHDLKASDYKFEITEAGNFSDRFTLQFNKSVLSTEELELSNSFVVSNENEEIRVKAGTNITDIKVYDMLGRLLITQQPNKSDFRIKSSVSNGSVLIVNATLDNGVEVSKKVIKY